MIKIMYEDCNNNSSYLKNIFVQIQGMSDLELNWKISDLDFIPVDRGDFIDGIPSTEMEKICFIQKKSLEEHVITITHKEFMDLLENIKTIYEGDFVIQIGDKESKVRVFDGDIIEIDGEIESDLKL